MAFQPGLYALRVYSEMSKSSRMKRRCTTLKVAIIGGFNFQRYEELNNKQEGLKLCFHDGKPRQRNKKKMESMINDADYVIIVQSVCSHSSMWDAKAVAKKCNKTIYYAHKQSLTSILNTIQKQHEGNTA